MRNPCFVPSLRALSLLAGLFLGGCGDKSQEGQPIETPNPYFEMKVGETRVMLRELSAVGDTLGMRSYSLGAFLVSKDTVVQGDTGYIVECAVHELSGDPAKVTLGRQLLVDRGNEVSLYTFRNGGLASFLFTVLKRADEDTAAFSDHIVALKNPLQAGGKWWIRPEANPWENAAFEREYVGDETVTIMGAPRLTRAYLLHGFVPVKSWVGPTGVVRASIDHGFITLQDSTGTKEETVPYKETYELVALNPTKAVMDSLIARYRAASGPIP